jgi:hypothetical protein
MQITLSSEQESYVRQGIETGRFKSEGQAVELAFEVLRAEDAILSNYSPEQLNSAIDEGIRDFDEGNFEPLTHDVFERVKREGRARLAQLESGR